MKRAVLAIAILGMSTISRAEVTVESFGKDEAKIKATLDDCKNRAVNLNSESADAQKCRAAKAAMRDLVFQPYVKKGNGKKY